MHTKQLLKKLVSIRSDFPNEEKIGEYLAHFLFEAGFTVEKQHVSPN